MVARALAVLQKYKEADHESGPPLRWEVSFLKNIRLFASFFGGLDPEKTCGIPNELRATEVAETGLGGIHGGNFCAETESSIYS